MHFEFFDILRLVACLLVTYSHHFEFYGQAQPSFGGISYGGLGVTIFFAISGFLLTLSQQRSTPKRFAARRILRIYPGLIVCTLLTVFIISILKLYDGSFSKDASQILAYLKNMLTPFFRMSHFVDGVFPNNHTKAINGSLWTIPYEIFAYFVLFVGYALKPTQRKYWSLGVCLFFALVALGSFLELKGPFPFIFEPKILTVALPLCAFFMASFLAHFPLDNFPQMLIKLSILCFILYLFMLPLNYSILAFIGFLVCFTLASGLLSSQLSRYYVKKIGDISYGFYLYSFPIQQIMVLWGLSFWPALGASILCCSITAYLSYHVIEKRFLSWKVK